MSPELSFALQLADVADRITMAHFLRPDLQVSEKADFTPVTEADRQTEACLRAAIRAEYPTHRILGEEFGTDDDDAGSGIGADPQWIIDPIDGTKNYLRGVPVWATLIALDTLAGGPGASREVRVGVVSAPALGRRWWAELGHGAWGRTTLGDFSNSSEHELAAGAPTPLRVSDVVDIKGASLAYASLTGWEAYGRLPALLELMRKCWRTRGYGDFWSYMLLAEGAVDIAAEPELETYDMAALVPIVTEAGGQFTSLAGRPGPWGGNAVATNGHLHAEVLAALA